MSMSVSRFGAGAAQRKRQTSLAGRTSKLSFAIDVASSRSEKKADARSPTSYAELSRERSGSAKRAAAAKPHQKAAQRHAEEAKTAKTWKHTLQMVPEGSEAEEEPEPCLDSDPEREQSNSEDKFEVMLAKDVELLRTSAAGCFLFLSLLAWSGRPSPTAS